MIVRRRYRWRGPQPDGLGELIANAPDTLFALSPVDGAAAASTTSNWAATLPSDIPFIWEDRHARQQEQCPQDDYV